MPSTLELFGSDHPTPIVWRMHFPWPRNPLPANGPRGNHYAHAREVKHIRTLTMLRARSLPIPSLGTCDAALVWWVNTRRRRDEDNLAPLEKPMFDGLVDAGVVPDDTPAYMSKPRARIQHLADHPDAPVTKPGFVLTVTGTARCQDCTHGKHHACIGNAMLVTPDDEIRSVDCACAILGHTSGGAA